MYPNPTFFSQLSMTRRTALGATLALVLAGCATPPAPVSLTQTIANTPELSTLSAMLTSSTLANTLQDGGPYTVLAPSNEAFKALPTKTQDMLAKDASALKNLLSYHVLSGQWKAEDIKNAKYKSMNGQELELSKAGDFVTVGESAIVTRANLAAKNGVVHIIDTVLMPPVKK